MSDIIGTITCCVCKNEKKKIITHRVLIDEIKPDSNNSYAYFHTQCMDEVLKAYVIKYRKETYANPR